ncbi:hypothetical protein [Mycolicibacterium grossiae]|uniref:Uncharacterized protein n=1 Tax=Mycolicibacterium grossiae TaxID=1552759 RepID=A0A1E8QAT0_9MYCO|nr:hypothetical protein [Mycolicibacterium grossiae]OFJ55180.1 hypothetical protein BEL07_03120 [Mycolicibacterium grossiae]QEM46095.1 hypothetical protein FZ046_16175 [Mycolicibacterium grossiae]
MTALKTSDLMAETQHGGPRRYTGPMVRLHNPQLRVQVYVAEAKAANLLASGYVHGPMPDDDKPANKTGRH